MANAFPFEPRCLPLAPFDLPYNDESKGWAAQQRWTPRFMSLPFVGVDAAWQLMAAGFPGRSTGKYIEDDQFERLLEHQQLAYLNDDLRYAHVPQFDRLLERVPWRQEAIPTIQMAIVGLYGAISTGLLLIDEEERPIFASAVGREAMLQHTYLRLRWLEHTLADIAHHFALCLIEPFWDTTKLPFLNYSAEEAFECVSELARVLSVPLGLAPSGTINWQQLLESPLSLLVCPWEQRYELLECGECVNRYFDRGGVLVWTIVPSDPERLTSSSVDGMLHDWEFLLKFALDHDVLNSRILNGSLLTIEAGLANQTAQTADQALALLADLSQRMRLKYKV